MRVKLFTALGQHVASEAIPPFNTTPDVLFWGQRVFTRPDVDGPTLDVAEDETPYVEAFTYAIPFATRTGGSER